jgi:hypothetical protein
MCFQFNLGAFRHFKSSNKIQEHYIVLTIYISSCERNWLWACSEVWTQELRVVEHLVGIRSAARRFGCRSWPVPEEPKRCDFFPEELSTYLPARTGSSARITQPSLLGSGQWAARAGAVQSPEISALICISQAAARCCGLLDAYINIYHHLSD